MTCTRPNSVAPSSPASRPTPSGWPPASLDPGSGRHNQTAVGSRSYKIKIPLSEVSSVSGDCLYRTPQETYNDYLTNQIAA
jgi:hypothetical protein